MFYTQLLTALVALMTTAFYLPGVAPRTFRYGDKVELKVNKLTSIHTQIPYDYYSLKFCRPRGEIKEVSTLTQKISATIISNRLQRIWASFCLETVS